MLNCLLMTSILVDYALRQLYGFKTFLLAMDVCVSSRGHEHYSTTIVLVPSPFSLLSVAGVQRGEAIQ